MQSLPITTKVMSSNPVHGEVYSIQHSVMKFVSDLRQVGVFFRVNGKIFFYYVRLDMVPCFTLTCTRIGMCMPISIPINLY
jgi:hypothetical protein